MRIALIHAVKHAIQPIEAAFAELWPEPRLANLLDESLSADLARDGAITPAMTARFRTLARYATDAGANGILFTCSAFGPCIEVCAGDLKPMPVLKPNEAMIAEALARAGGGPIGLLASFAGTLASMPPEFPAGTKLVPCLAEGAMKALDRGDGPLHDRLVVEAATASLRGCAVIALTQFSMARAAAAVEAATGLPVLSTPGSAVRRLKSLLN